jgi:hypothetical protein
MTQSNRGAAQVGLMWAIALLVVALVSIFLAYSATSKVTETNAQLVTANAEVGKLKIDIGDMRNKDAAVGKAVGWQPEGDTTALPILNPIRDSLAELGAIFPSVDPNATVVQSTLPGLIADYKGSQTRVSDLEQQVAQLRADLDARQSEADTTVGEKDSKISELEGQLQDTRTSMDETILDTERQRDALRDQFQSLDEQHSSMIAQKDSEILQIKNASLNLKQRNDILSNRVNGVQRRADQPDGSVLTANAKVAKAWIDLGRTDRLAPGLQFEVLDKTTGAVKGRLQVSSIEENRAECEVVSVSDRFNPVGTGDLVRNAVFDRTRTPVAVLLGKGFGRYNASDMKAKLAEVGIAVVEEVGVETDYLLLGTPFFDEETGEMLPWAGQDSYKVAQGMSVEIVPRRDWLAWLGL